MVIDAARGIEAQTRKLFEVCRMRNVPIITFINKVDREGRAPFELLDEVADALALDVTPMSWPVGMGGMFEGIYDLSKNVLHRPAQDATGAFEGDSVPVGGLDDSDLDSLLSADAVALLREEAELAMAGYGGFDETAYRAGDQTPVYFGSALKDFGVEQLIDALAGFAPPPRPQPADTRTVEPDETQVAGFIFKVQANMNPQHRDRVAFMRLCAGRFRRGMKLAQVGTGKTIAVHSPLLFLARDRELAEEAYPGDIIGIPNHGTLRVGDTLTEGEAIRFTGIPNFAPEILRRVRLADPTKTKQLRNALNDMAEEGVMQVFFPQIGSSWIVGVVGQLQLDVMISRLQAEYKVDAGFEPSPWDTARWVTSDDAKALDSFMSEYRGAMAEDRDGEPVFMAKDSWELSYVSGRFPAIKFHATKERR
jgi:peptide chain release factor 3